MVESIVGRVTDLSRVKEVNWIPLHITDLHIPTYPTLPYLVYSERESVAG